MPDESKVEVTTTTVSVGSSTGFSPFAYARTEWEILKNSKTVKGLIAMEAAAIGVFVEQVFSGDQKITIAALQGWFCVQAALIVAFLLRQDRDGHSGSSRQDLGGQGPSQCSGCALGRLQEGDVDHGLPNAPHEPDAGGRDH